MKSNVELFRGLQSLLEVAIDQGASAVERIHLATSARTFVVLGAIPVVAEPAALVRTVHDAIVATSYAATRGVNRLVGIAVRAGLDLAEGDEARAALAVAPSLEVSA